MRLAVYGAVLVIALGSVLLGLDRLPAPMSPMVDTAAGLAAAPAPPLPAPIAATTSSAPNAIRRPQPASPPLGAQTRLKAHRQVRRGAHPLSRRRLPRLQGLPLPHLLELP